MKYISFSFLMLLFCYSAFSQSKKEQIETLIFQKDSLGRVLEKERLLNNDKIKELETKISKINSELALVQKNLAQSKEGLIQSKKVIDEKEEEILRIQVEKASRDDAILRLQAELDQFKSSELSSSDQIVIGGKVWMNKNLDVSKFRNGDPIPQATTLEEWVEFNEKNQPAWSYYENDPANGKKYGKIYNWFAVNDPRGLAPKGWHVASSKEWENLIYSQGGFTEETAKKFMDTEDWGISFSPNSNGFNFNAKPGGTIRSFGSAGYLHYSEMEYEKCAFWWTSTKSTYLQDGIPIPAAKAIYIIFNSDQDFSFEFNLNDVYNASGLSVRCVKD